MHATVTVTSGALNSVRLPQLPHQSQPLANIHRRQRRPHVCSSHSDTQSTVPKLATRRSLKNDQRPHASCGHSGHPVRQPQPFNQCAKIHHQEMSTSTVALRIVGGNEKGSLRSETVKYCPDSHGTCLPRASSSCERQACPLVRESTPHQQTRNCLTVIKVWLYAPDGCLFQDRLAD
jgi:hypothetical protein